MFKAGGPTWLELAQQGLSSTRRGYDLLAPKFDRTPFMTPPELVEQTLAVAGGLPVATALDVCCGTGVGLAALRPHVGRRLVGIDVSEPMLAQAGQRVRGPGVELIPGDALEMTFDREFDLAVSFGAFGHIPSCDEPEFARRVFRSLRPGGRFIFLSGSKPKRTSPVYWFARGYNAVTRVRNALRDPPFVMYYLTFLLPDVKYVLQGQGFSVSVVEDALEGYPGAAVVIATRPSG